MFSGSNLGEAVDLPQYFVERRNQISVTGRERRRRLLTEVSLERADTIYVR